ncbi:MAG TPA: AtpZ/AtpI family protein [Candidatus Sulfotelmatobacter sp.]|nr:AtpZ/AtpI family protein [Candidatus Sulfotelmatobacter sp.]
MSAPRAERGGKARDRTRRDLDRLDRREPGGRFWQSLALIGSVGWPIVLFATGGALLGHLLDRHWSSGIRFTLMLLTIGTAIGCFAAYRAVRGNDS